MGAFLSLHSARWFLRARFLKISKTIPLWDLVAALFLLAPEHFQVEETSASLLFGRGFRFGEGDRKITVLNHFEKEPLWSLFEKLLAKE